MEEGISRLLVVNWDLFSRDGKRGQSLFLRREWLTITREVIFVNFYHSVMVFTFSSASLLPVYSLG